MSEAQKTPAAKWRQEGQADPHGDHYNCQRAALTLGEYTDDELANGVFLHGNEPLNINALLRKTPGYHSAIVWLTAAKDRIRWLSRSLEESAAREQALQLRLNAADQRIDELTAQHHSEDSLDMVGGLRVVVDPTLAPDEIRLVLPADAERERLTAIIENYPNGDPLEYNAALRKIQL